MSVAVATAKSDQSGVYEREDLLNGCQAVAQGVRLADVDVIAAYPIRPYTEVMDALSKLIADGQVRRRVHHRGQRALPVRDRQARQLGERARLRRIERHGLDVRYGSAGRYRDRPSPTAFRGGQPRSG